MSEMTTKEALSAAAQMKNVFGAFKHLEDVLMKVAGAEGLVGEFTRQRDLLASELVTLKQRLEENTAKLNEKVAEWRVSEQEAAERAAAKTQELDAELTEKREAGERAIAELDADIIVREGIYQEHIGKMSIDTQKRQGKIDKLNAVYTGLKAKVDQI